jgi:integrase
VSGPFHIPSTFAPERRRPRSPSPARRERAGRSTTWTPSAIGAGRPGPPISYKEAAAAQRQRQAESDEIRAGARPALPPEKRWEDLVAPWEEVKHQKRSLRDDLSRIRLHLTPAFRGDLLQEITPQRIVRLERDLHRRMKINTVRQVIGTLRAMLRLAVEHGWLVAAPRIKLPRAPDLDYQWIRSEEDMARFLQVASEQEFPGLTEFYATALYTGMRAGELCGLRWSDVDLERRLITVQRSFESVTKSSRIRRVPILDPLLPVLTAWKGVCASGDLVFPNLEGKMHVSHARIMKQTYHRCRELAGIPFMTFHHAPPPDSTGSRRDALHGPASIAGPQDAEVSWNTVPPRPPINRPHLPSLVVRSRTLSTIRPPAGCPGCLPGRGLTTAGHPRPGFAPTTLCSSASSASMSLQTTTRPEAWMVATNGAA